MQESWQMFMTPAAASTPHVDAAFQAGVYAPATSMAGRVLFPYPRWSDILETDSRTHGEHAGNNLATMVHTEAENAGLYATTTHQNLGMMATAAAENDVKADGHIVSTSDLSSIRSSQYSAHPLGIMSTMAQINQINEMNNKQDMNKKKLVTQPNSKRDMQINNTHDEGESNSKSCKQNVVQHRHPPTVHAVPRCQIDGCKQDLSKAKKEYHRRHKVCEMHSKASSVVKCGLQQRFCQQCSRFHVVSDFDDAKRSCRRRLEGHNRRRRKSISQGYGNLVGLNQIMQHQLMTATAMMVPLPQQVHFDQEKNNYKTINLQEIQNEKNYSTSKNTFPSSFDERLLALLNYNTKNATLSSPSPSSSSSSPSSIFNHGDTTCALSLLSCNASLDQFLAQSIEENPLNPNISSSLITPTLGPTHFTFPSATSLASMINLNPNNSNAIKYSQPSQSMSSRVGKIESSSLVDSIKELSYNSYPHVNYWKNLGSLQNLEQHHNANIIGEL